MSSSNSPPPPAPGRRGPWAGIALVAWFLLAFWVGRTIVEVSAIRDRIDRQNAWVDDAEDFRASFTSWAAPPRHPPGVGPHPPARVGEARWAGFEPPAALEEQLRRGHLTARAPEVEYGAGLSAWRGLEHRALETIRDLQALAQAGAEPSHMRRTHARLNRQVAELSLEVTEAVRSVRAAIARESRALAARWSGMVAIAGLLLACAAGLGVLFVRTRGHKRALLASARALGESEERHRARLETAQGVIFSLDATGAWTFVNPVVEEVLGRTPAQLDGRSMEEIVDPEALAAHRALLARVRAGEAVTGEELVWCHADGGQRTVVLSARALYGPAGEVGGIAGTVTDITELRGMQEALMRKERLQNLGNLAGGIAHDFNNVLAAVIGHTQLLRTAAPDEDPREHTEPILEAADRAKRLTRQLLTFARRQPLQRRSLGLHALVEGTERMLVRLVGDEIRLRSRLPGSELHVRGDLSQLEQVVVNLVINARDAIDGDGEITIAVRPLDPRKDVPHEASPSGAWAVLEVRDTGCGMDRETVARALEPFFSTKGTGRGTGLGLATVDAVVSQHRGELQILSRPGAGTCVRVFLPQEQPEAAPADEAPPVPRAGLGGRRIGVAEDEPMVRDVVVAMLQDAGAEVVTPDGLETALDDLAAHVHDLDLLLTDVRMPHVSGPELATGLRALRPDLPVLFMSGYSGDQLGDGWISHQNAGLILKPFRVHELLAAIDRRLRTPAPVEEDGVVA